MLRLLLIINVVVCVVLALLVGWRGYELWLMYGGGRDADANALIDCVRKLGGLHSGLMEGGFDKAVLEYDLNARPVVDKKVAYGYDSRARLVEERMYSHPQGKLVQRVIYKYDNRGNRSKPLIVSLNTAGPVTEIAPTMQDDVNAINRQMKQQGRGRR